MKTFVISVVILCNITFGFAQMIDLDKGRTIKIEIVNIHGGLNIIGTNSNRILIERIKYNDIPESIREPLETQGYKNSDLEDLSLQNIGNKLIVSPANIKGQFADYNLEVPKEMIINIKTDVKILYKEQWNKGDVFSYVHNKISISNLEGEIILSTYTASVYFNEITGPITCDLYNGQINVTFSKLKPETKSTISIFEGKVNLYLNKNIACFVELAVESGIEEESDYGTGNINSEFDIENVELESPGNLWVSKLEKGKAINLNAIKNPKIKGEINGGGKNTFVISVYRGDINLFNKEN